MSESEPRVPESKITDLSLTVQERTEQLIEDMSQQLAAAVEVVAPGSDAEIKDVFTLPSERRDDDPGLELTAEQETNLREVAAQLGWGRQADKTPESQGLNPGFTAIIEGGQPHKVMTELLVASAGQPGLYFVAGSPNRQITNEAERASGCNILGVSGDALADTEYDVNRQLVESMVGYAALDGGDLVLDASYDIDNGNQPSVGQSGQFVRIGHINGSPVVLMRIDREDYMDGDQPKYRKQPDSAGVMKIVSEVAGGLVHSDQIGFVTSSTYEPSRSVDQIRSWAQTGRQIELVTYGTDSLARVKGVPSQPGPINQLPGELRKADASLQLLKQELAV